MDFTELPLTNAVIDAYPYTPFDDPARNLAERLIALGHLGFNRDVWASSPERIKRYWVAYNEHIKGSANTNRLSTWWSQVTEGMVIQPFIKPEYLHEKNLLLSPEHLSTPVEEQDVLSVFRTDSDYLIDRARMWAKVRRDTKNTDTPTPQEPTA